MNMDIVVLRNYFNKMRIKNQKSKLKFKNENQNRILKLKSEREN